ncbi:MAG: twin-arginine translocase TatA/TatE family subunit [Acidobacteria bacterium]|nr:MAG: twin-arginine translocase TatA/TatE family subunit [Acidobacteriota bacterium]
MPLLLFGSLGLPEILLIFALILLLFGPKKLPEIGKSLGKGIREFKKGTSGIMDGLNDAVNAQPEKPKPKAAPVQKAIEPPQAAVEDVKGIVVDLESEEEK